MTHSYKWLYQSYNFFETLLLLGILGESFEGRLRFWSGKLRIGDVVKSANDVDDKGENLVADVKFSLLLFEMLVDAGGIFFFGDGDLVINSRKFSGVNPNCIEARLEIL